MKLISAKLIFTYFIRTDNKKRHDANNYKRRNLSTTDTGKYLNISEDCVRGSLPTKLRAGRDSVYNIYIGLFTTSK